MIRNRWREGTWELTVITNELPDIIRAERRLLLRQVNVQKRMGNCDTFHLPVNLDNGSVLESLPLALLAVIGNSPTSLRSQAI